MQDLLKRAAKHTVLGWVGFLPGDWLRSIGREEAGLEPWSVANFDNVDLHKRAFWMERRAQVKVQN